MTKPDIEFGDFAASPATPRLAGAISRVAKALDELGAWPSHDFAPYRIMLVPGNAIDTRWGALASRRPGRTMEINPQSPLRIEIGIDLFTQGVCRSLASAGNVSNEVVLFHLLAHEIFHLTELDRMSRSAVPYGQQNSGFAKALRPDFHARWREAGLTLSEKFPLVRLGAANAASLPPQKRFGLECWRAADVASEACADLLALNLMRKASQPYAAGVANFTPALLAHRQAEEDRALAAGSTANPGYQIGTALSELLQRGPMTDQDIVASTWDKAFRLACTAPEIFPEVRALIEGLPSLTFAASKGPKI